jgi:hypothetical protein
MRDPGQRARYVEGKFAFVQSGAPVAPEYNEKLHYLEYDHKVIAGATGFRFYDPGHYTAIIMGQISPAGHIQVMDAFLGENTGMKSLLENSVLPRMEEKYSEVQKWRDIGDPNMVKAEATDITTSPVSVIHQVLGARFEPGPKDWPTRLEALKMALSRLIDGYPMLQISKCAGLLHQCLRGGWAYPTDNSGNVAGSGWPKKNRWSHLGEALSYGLAVVLGLYSRAGFDQQNARMTRQAAARRLYGRYGVRTK